MAKLKVMIIDDDDVTRGLLCSLLGGAGIFVIEAANGIEGERLFNQHRPDIIFTDIFMPDQDGIQTIINIRRICKTVPIVAMSAGGPERTSDYLNYASRLGASHVIGKSFSIREILDVIKRLTKDRMLSSNNRIDKIPTPSNSVHSLMS